MDEPIAQTEHLPGHAVLPHGASHLSMLPSMQQEAMNGHEQQTDAIPVLLVQPRGNSAGGRVCLTNRMWAHLALEHCLPTGVRPQAH